MAFNDKKLVYALRHNPAKFGLHPDNQGWVDLHVFLDAMGISRADLDYVIANMDKKRLEIQGNKVRAVYGHSFSDKVQHQESKPPEVLYHGTTPFNAFVIRKEGLKPMSRQYVHLSTTPDTASIVGQRRSEEPIILTINSKKAFKNGVKFYHTNEDIWLADFIAPEYIN